MNHIGIIRTFARVYQKYLTHPLVYWVRGALVCPSDPLHLRERVDIGK